MNVYDSERIAHSLASHGFRSTDRPDEADLVILNTCHIREKAAEKVYSELGRLRIARDARRAAGSDHADRGRRLRRPGRGRSPGRARPLRRHRRRTAGLPPPAGAAGPPPAPGRRGGRHRVPGREQVRRAAAGPYGRRPRRFPLGPGRLRQVLHVLRGALYARCRGQPAGRCHPGRGAAPRGHGRARDHAPGPERERLSWRGTRRPHLDLRPADPGPGRAARAGPHPLHDLAPPRHGRRADRVPMATCRS